MGRIEAEQTVEAVNRPAHEVHAAHAEGVGPGGEVSASSFQQLLHAVSVCLPRQLVHSQDVDDGKPQLVWWGPFLPLQHGGNWPC